MISQNLTFTRPLFDKLLELRNVIRSVELTGFERASINLALSQCFGALGELAEKYCQDIDSEHRAGYGNGNPHRTL